ncbi:ABC transporter six-transmembrane domain-containing protein [Pantoea piersonii]|uniref:ABC transporter six-transmembrane domain-containing protein n=1 Tax=Pantoea piersonii TaxID=2364647 RepID=UPI0028AC296B|nr:ABC transporter six-transmembrane domain-containing protein [Pantoea piersonii]
MQPLNLNEKADIKPGAATTLKLLGQRHRRKLAVTLMLVVGENLIYLLYPLLAGFAVNAILAGKAIHAVLYAALVFVMWLTGAARRSVDTRTFARIYAELAVSVVLAQRRENHPPSTVAARVTLSREFVDFFEKHLPVLITTVASITGATVMLLFIEFWSGIACLGILAFFSLFLRLNNRLEKEVSMVSSAAASPLVRHYRVLARLRIALSDREALGYLSIGAVAALLFGSTILMMTMRESHDAGHVYSVMTYMWMFAMSLDDGPQLLEKYSQLRDIGKRVKTGKV